MDDDGSVSSPNACNDRAVMTWQTFYVEPETLQLEIGETKEIRVWAFPSEVKAYQVRERPYSQGGWTRICVRLSIPHRTKTMMARSCLHNFESVEVPGRMVGIHSNNG